MRKLVPILFLTLALCSTAHAQWFSFDLDTQYPTEPITLEKVFSGNTPWLRTRLYEEGVGLVLTNWSLFFSYNYGQYNTNGMITLTGTQNTNVWTFEGSTNLFFEEFDDYYWSVWGTNTSSRVKTFGSGRMIQDYDPATGDPSALTWLTTLNWDSFSFIGTAPWASATNLYTDADVTNVIYTYFPNIDNAAYVNTNNTFLYDNTFSSTVDVRTVLEVGASGNGGYLIASAAGVTVNDGSAAAVDFRVESDSNQYMFFIDSESNSVAVGTTNINMGLATFIVDGSAAILGGPFTVGGTNLLGLIGGISNIIFDADWNSATGWLSSAAYGIATADSNYWDTAADWLAGGASNAIVAWTSNWITAYGHATNWAGSPSYRVTDAMTNNTIQAYTWLLARTNYFASNTSNWQTAYGWGNHATYGYLTGVSKNNFRSLTIADTNALGSELISNGDFGTNAVDWKLTQATVSGERLSVAIGQTGVIEQSNTLNIAVGKMYHVSFYRSTSDSEEFITLTMGGRTNTWGPGGDGSNWISAVVQTINTNDPVWTVTPTNDAVFLDDISVTMIQDGDLGAYTGYFTDGLFLRGTSVITVAYLDDFSNAVGILSEPNIWTDTNTFNAHTYLRTLTTDHPLTIHSNSTLLARFEADGDLRMSSHGQIQQIGDGTDTNDAWTAQQITTLGTIISNAFGTADTGVSNGLVNYVDLQDVAYSNSLANYANLQDIAYSNSVTTLLQAEIVAHSNSLSLLHDELYTGWTNNGNAGSYRLTFLGDPTATNDAVNVQYLNNRLASTATYYFWGSTTSSVTDYYKMDMLPSGSNQTAILSSGTTNNHYVAQYISNVGEPALTQVRAGTYSVRVYAKKGPSGAATLSAEGYLLAADGSFKYEVDETPVSRALTTTISDYDLDIVLPTNIPSEVTDRWAIKIRANVSSGSPDITTYTEGITESYLTGSGGASVEQDPYYTAQTNDLAWQTKENLFKSPSGSNYFTGDVIVSNRMGIGTNIPTDTLTVQASGNDDGIELYSSAGNRVAWLHQQSDYEGVFRFGAADNVILGGVSNSPFISLGQTAEADWKILAASSGLFFQENTTNRVTIQQLGNVGIGTNAPSAGIHVEVTGGRHPLLLTAGGTNLVKVYNSGRTLFGTNTAAPISVVQIEYRGGAESGLLLRNLDTGKNACGMMAADNGGRCLIYNAAGEVGADLRGVTASVFLHGILVGTNNGNYDVTMNGDLAIYADNTAIPAASAGHAILYATNASSAHMYGMDGEGNSTLLFPHHDDVWYHESWNRYTGRRVEINMEEAMIALLQAAGRSDLYNITYDLPYDDWDAVQEDLYQQSLRDAEADQAAIDAWETSSDPEKGKKGKKPKKRNAHVKRPRPQWITDRLKENPHVEVHP